MASSTYRGLRVGLIGLVILVVAVITGFRVEHEQCTICGVQRWQRSIFGIQLASLSESEYDEYGTYEAWRKMHGRTCKHRWVPFGE